MEFMTNLAKKDTIKGKFAVTWTNTAEFGQVLEGMFGVKEFPNIVVQKKAGDKKYWLFKDEIKED